MPHSPCLIYLLIVLCATPFFMVARSLTVLFHELGHAILYILLTRQKVVIYIGSQGDTKNSFNIKIGLLEAWIKVSWFWNQGLCISSAKKIPINKRIICVCGGPMASLVVLVIATNLVLNVNKQQVWEGMFHLSIIISSVLDLIGSFVLPSPQPAFINGKAAYNDWHTLKILFHAYRNQADKKDIN